jgi:hypothetical protein
MDCERVRRAVMASLDGEGNSPSMLDQEHLSQCLSCAAWSKDLYATAAALQGLPYERSSIDLWAAVERRIADSEPTLNLGGRVILIGVAVLGWRALQLFMDLPLPALHPLIALLATAVAAWAMAGNPLAIETTAPELEDRGV